MRRSVFLVAAMLPLLAAPAFAQKPARPVPIQKLDRVSTQVTGRKLIIRASGAVNSGGWTAPHLNVGPHRRAEANTLVVDFLATPPPAGAAVIQGLMPVSATLTTTLPRYGVTQVKVQSATNSIAAPIGSTR